MVNTICVFFVTDVLQNINISCIVIHEVMVVRLKEVMEVRGKSQTEVARDLGLTAQAVSNYANGYREPDFETLIRLADYFDVTADYLIGRPEKEDTTQPFSFGAVENAGRRMTLDVDEEITLQVGGAVIHISIEKI